MTIAKLLPSPVIFMLLLPSPTTLLLLIKPLLRILQNEATMAFIWPLNSASLDRYLSVFDQELSNADAGMSQYKRPPGEQDKCIFCLSDIGEGEEIRKLKCSHLFHRSCLDEWLQHQRETCPLCRCSLASFEAAEKPEEMDDDEADDFAPLLAFVQSQWWGRCVLLIEEGFLG